MRGMGCSSLVDVWSPWYFPGREKERREGGSLNVDETSLIIQKDATATAISLTHTFESLS